MASLLLGSFVAAALVAALVSTPGLRLAIAVALTAAAWMLTETDVVFARGERGVLAGLVGLGMLLGLVVGSQAMRGMLPAATLFAVLAGLTPATWPRGLLLAVALALPFWVATSERAAETAIALARVVAVWLVSVVFSMSLWAGFASLEVGALADPKAAALDIGRGFVSLHLGARHRDRHDGARDRHPDVLDHDRRGHRSRADRQRRQDAGHAEDRLRAERADASVRPRSSPLRVVRRAAHDRRPSP